jgi:putative transposase
VKAFNKAIHKFGPPEITNTDQGSQFTSFIWTDRLKRVGTQISMDGKGRWITFYNHQRPHTAHGGQPPAVVYFTTIETDQQVQAVA